MYRRTYFIAVSVVMLVVGGALSLGERSSHRLKLALSSVFLPLIGLGGSAGSLTERLAQGLASRQEVVHRLHQLEKENQELRFQQVQAEETQRENDLLRQLIGWQRRTQWKLKLGRVLTRDPANWWHTIAIDLGQRDGVTTNAAVLTPEGLIGRVTQVGANRSQVVLLGDPACRLSAYILETRDHGIIAGSPSSSDQKVVVLTFLPNSEQIRPGLWVMTSGLGLFPAGIPVGKILDTRRIGHGLYTEARVTVAANLSRLDQVFVTIP